MQSVVMLRPKKKRRKEKEAWARMWVGRHFINAELEEKKGLKAEKDKMKEGLPHRDKMGQKNTKVQKRTEYIWRKEQRCRGFVKDEEKLEGLGRG